MLPFFVSEVPLECINEAAYEYKIPAKLIISVLNIERGKIGLKSRNKNGTYDLGPMQINTSWWPALASYGITQEAVLYNSCTNVKVGAWILGKAIANGDNLIKGLGDYHSHTPQYNQAYAQQVRIIYTRLNGL